MRFEEAQQLWLRAALGYETAQDFERFMAQITKVTKGHAETQRIADLLEVPRWLVDPATPRRWRDRHVLWEIGVRWRRIRRAAPRRRR